MFPVGLWHELAAFGAGSLGEARPSPQCRLCPQLDEWTQTPTFFPCRACNVSVSEDVPRESGGLAELH